MASTSNDPLVQDRGLCVPGEPRQPNQLRAQGRAFSFRKRLEGMSFEIVNTWDGHPHGHDPYKVTMHWLFERRPGKPHKRAIKVDMYGPFHDDCEVPDEVGYCPNLWEYEVFELFLANAQDEYVEIEVGPHGNWLVYLLKGSRNVFNKGEELDLPILVNELADGGSAWHVQFEIPLAWLPAGVDRMNAYAIHGTGKDRVYESLYPVTDGTHTEPDFHRLEYMKKVDFAQMIPDGINDRVYLDYCYGPLWTGLGTGSSTSTKTESTSGTTS